MSKIEYEWELDLKNTAYYDEYRKKFDDYCAEVLADGVFSDVREKNVGEGYVLSICHICIEKDGKACISKLSECVLKTADGKEVFRFKAIERTLSKVIAIDGELYFFYTDNLYGYNVLRLSDMAEYRYFPKASSSFGEFRETFIWTDFVYNAKEHIFAVEGCYWACYYETMLYRIPDVMKPFTEICCPREFLDCDFYDLANTEPVKWIDDVLEINCSEAEKDDDELGNVIFRITKQEYTDNMHKVNI